MTSEAHPESVREGWVLVPVEPTREMWAAAGDAVVSAHQHGRRDHDSIAFAVWSGMLAAAPKPAQGSE